MPFVKVNLTQGSLTAEQRQDLLEKVTDAVVAVEGEPMRTGVAVAIDECSTLSSCNPFVAITLIKEALSTEQRQMMLQQVTDAIVMVVGEEKRLGVWVVIEESVNSGEWSIGGNSLTIAAMNRIKAGQNPWA